MPVEVFLVFHEWRDSDAYEYPQWHSELVKVFDTEDKAKEFVRAQLWYEENSYTWGRRKVE